MIDRQPSKRPRPHVDKSNLSLEDQLAFERVARIMNKPLSQLFEENPNHTIVGPRNNILDQYPAEEIMYAGPQPWPTPTMQWANMDEWQHQNGSREVDNLAFQPNGPCIQAAGTIFEEESLGDVNFNQWTHNIGQTPARNAESKEDNGHTENPNQRIHRSNSWSHEATADEPWVAVPTDFLIQTSLQDEGIDNTDTEARLEDTGGERPTQGSTIPMQDDQSAFGTRLLKQNWNTTDRTLNHLSSSPSSNLIDSDGVELDWEELKMPQVSGSGSQLPSFADTATNGWSMIELSKPHDTFLLDKSNPKSLKWVSTDSSGKELSSQKPQRRGPFQNPQLREETSITRRLKACVRCQRQKIRCQINPNDPSGDCQTCQEVSKQKIHTLPCVRYRLSECTLYRIGKAPGLEFTFRWPVMKLKDISEWSNMETRTIKVISDVCPIPLELTVRKFVPKLQDSLKKSWMDGKVKKFKETTPYAIVNMSAAVKEMREYINRHVFQCVEYWLDGRDDWIQETYRFARQYMKTAPLEEGHLLADFFRLWFAVRRTATTEYIGGDDTLDMEPETVDRSYPLFGKVPLPPVMIQQLDMILTLGFLTPLRKKVLEDFQKIVSNNKPKSWMTIYLITFMSLHSCATLTDENYKNARKHGLKRRFAMPNFIAERHHSANVFLSHYHYCTKPCDPFKIDWRKRQSNPYAEMTPKEIDFLLTTSEMVKARRDKFRRIHAIDIYEDDLYFVSQMFEEDWAPKDTPIDHSDEVVTGEPQKPGSPKHKE